jgi:hypothetical protein
MSRIDDAMSRFSAIRGSSVGHGPRHPADPDTEIAPRIERFLETYPALRDDASYVEFLEKYAGASIENDDFSQIVDILGFTEASTDIEEMDGPIVDSQGFLMVAEAVYHLREGARTTDTLQHAFAYDMTGGRPKGLYYSLVTTQHLEPAFTHEFENFEAWLDDLVAREGWLDPPGRR